jgi:NTE family protein
VAAAYAAGEIDRFERWLLDLKLADVIAFLDVRFLGGLIEGERLMEFFRRNFIDRPVEELPLPFGAVATELSTGNEVWLREGSTIDAVRASIALPGLFTPVARDGHLLVDGGLVNPVPVSLARAMGADVVIAVDLSADVLGRHLRPKARRVKEGEVSAWLARLQERLAGLLPRNGRPMPSLLDVVASSINIMQVRIARSRMAGEPPDAVVAPRLAHLGLMEFHRAKEAIEEGRRATRAALPQIRAALEEWA